MEWHELVDDMRSYVVRINTPQASGTGFVLWPAHDLGPCAVATAGHVVRHAHYWEQPIRVHLAATGTTKLLRAADRAVLLDYDRDTAVVLFDAGDLNLPSTPIQLIGEDKMLKVGVEIGWLGYPVIPAADLCFFTGGISAWVKQFDGYFVDGVTINGVSGGPAFSEGVGGPYVIGVVSAYVPNRATGEVLPGVGLVRDVTQLQEVARRIRSLQEAKEKEDEPEEPPAAGPDEITESGSFP